MSLDQMITISVMDRTYQIKCPPNAVIELQEAAAILNAEISKIKQTAQSGQTERLLVVAALNLAHDLLMTKHREAAHMDALNTQMKSLQYRIQKFLETKDEVAV